MNKGIENDSVLIIKLFVKTLEEKIKAKPANYLWSHRRWRYTYDAAQFGHLVVE